MTELQNYLKLKLDYYNKKIEEFKKEFNESPSHALDWSKSIFQQVAFKEVLDVILNDIQNDIHINKILRYLEKSILMESKYPSYSTSPVSNFYAQCVLSAKASILEDIKTIKGDILSER